MRPPTYSKDVEELREILASGYQISVFKATWNSAQGVFDSPGAMRCEVTSYPCCKAAIQGETVEGDGLLALMEN